MAFITLYKCGLIQLILSFTLLISGIGVFFFADYMLKEQIHKNVMIKNDTDHPAYKIWKNPTDNSTVYRKYYLFSIQNPEELESGKETKPRLLELGPFVYREVMYKTNIKFSEDKRSVSYAPVTDLRFAPELSNGTLQDKVTFFNVPAWGMIDSVTKGSFPTLTADAVNLLFAVFRIKMFVTKTVDELISGYVDPLLVAAKALGYVTDDTFSLLNGKNGTAYTNYTMNTGIDTVKDIGKLYAWNNQSKMNIWYNDKANTLRGTDGTIYPPFMTKDDTMFSFNPDMCRSFTLKFERENELDGVKTYQFHLPQNVFYNSTLNKDNDGFCNGDCIANGVQNISKCYGNVSSFISQPHFLNADPIFLDMVTGLKPDKEKHDLYLQFHPITGVALSGSIKFMISFWYAPNKLISITKNLKPTVLPMVWFDELILLDKDSRSQIGTVSVIADICYYLPIAMMVGGGCGIITSIIMILINFYKKKNNACMESKEAGHGITNNLLGNDQKKLVITKEYSINNDQEKSVNAYMPKIDEEQEKVH